jgi:hypothetical protein
MEQAVRKVRNSGNIQGTFREHSGNIQGTFREHSGNIQCCAPGPVRDGGGREEGEVSIGK